MSQHTQLAKITRATFGFGGYDDAMMGLSLSFMGDSIGTSEFVGTWASRSPNASWTVESQRLLFAAAVEKLRDVLRDAKKMHVAELVGTPVELTFEGNMLSSWRVLTEVL